MVPRCRGGSGVCGVGALVGGGGGSVCVSRYAFKLQ